MHAWTDGSDYLMHYGILGQKWGLRRFQNDDGTLTAAGKERYGKNAKLVGRKLESTNTAVNTAKKVSKIGRNIQGAAVGTAYGIMGASLLAVNPAMGIAYIAGGIGGSILGTAIQKKIDNVVINGVADIYIKNLDKQYAKEGEAHVNGLSSKN